MGPEGKLHSVPDREPPNTGAGPCRGRRDERVDGVVGLAAGVLAALWFYSRLSPDVAFSIWQGGACIAATGLDDSWLGSLPILLRWAARLVGTMPFGSAAWRLNLVSVFFGAGSCGLLAAIGARIAGRVPIGARIGAPERAWCGLMAAAVFALAPRTTYACTAVSPAPLTTFLALAAVACVFSAWDTAPSDADRRRRRGFVMGAGFLAGLATSNHPSFGILMLVLLLSVQSHDGAEPRRLHPLGVFVIGGMAGASIPILVAIGRGESFHDFLSHALRAPYPTLADAAPASGFARMLVEELPAGVLAVAPAAIPLLFFTATRPMTLLWAVLFLCFGPFLPALTNQYGATEMVRDSDAPMLVVLAAVSQFAALGALAALRAPFTFHETSGKRRPLMQTVLYGATILVFTSVLGQGAPDRNHPLARACGEALFEGCPENAVILSGDPSLTSLLISTQQTGGLRPDVRVIPSHSLINRLPRRGLRTILSNDIALTSSFPPVGAFERWEHEQPALAAELFALESQNRDATPALLDLAVWDFLRDNSHRHRLYFVGFSQEWLLARVRASGCVLRFPSREVPARGRLPVEDDAAEAARASARSIVQLCFKALDHPKWDKDPAVAETLCMIVLPSSANARKQGNAAVAERWARTAIGLAPGYAEGYLALARAAARDGNKEGAIRAAERYLELAENGAPALPTAELIKSDLDLWARVERFRELMSGAMLSPGQWKESDTLAGTLWLNHELVVLATGYATVLETQPDNPGVLYQYAAALAQLGEFPRAEEALLRAMELAPADVPQRLRQDGRFVQLRLTTISSHTI